MPKTEKKYKGQLSLLVPEGDFHKLVAIAYYRGKKRYSDVSRSMLSDGIVKFEKSLGPKDKKRFDEILQNVKISFQNGARSRSRIQQTDEW